MLMLIMVTVRGVTCSCVFKDSWFSRIRWGLSADSSSFAQIAINSLKKSDLEAVEAAL